MKTLFLGMNKEALKEKFSEPEGLQIHSVFHRVINIESNDGLLSVVTPGIGRMADYIVIQDTENEDFISAGIKIGGRCCMKNQQITVDKKLYIDLNEAVLWRGILDKGYTWRAQELKADNLSVLQSALNIYAVYESAYKRIYERKEKYLTDAAEKLKFQNSYDLILSGVKELIGFGPGLTPSGDDFLTGYLAVITSCNENTAIRKFAPDIIYQNSVRTNYISSCMLSNAAEGTFHEYIQDLIFAVTAETPERVMQCTKRLIRTGATSGSDIAAGIYTGFVNAEEYFNRKAR